MNKRGAHPSYTMNSPTMTNIPFASNDDGDDYNAPLPEYPDTTKMKNKAEKDQG